MKLIDLLNCMEDTVVISIVTGDEWDYEVYVSDTKIARIPKDLISIVSNRIVKDIYTFNDVIKITVE